MLLDTLKWRDEFKPDELTVEDVKVFYVNFYLFFYFYYLF